MDGWMDGREIGTIESVPIGYSRLDNRVPAGPFALIAVWVFMILCEMVCASKSKRLCYIKPRLVLI